ncbi:sensor domain-containing diguanylate cyclase [Marinobacter changyiensis]|uniref:sensor domain-containing diguanylate cyclase n=1 Tax=Marinobacter changyiensis TaxID=2604091 RepID=UPI00126566CA|nr:sensor domain-containing diguanylate cyclase [Marinobacter changyiensis]
MFQAQLSTNESQREHAIQALGVLGAVPEERFERLTRMAKRIFDVPLALVSFIDTEDKASSNLDIPDALHEFRFFCDYSIRNDGLFIVPNTLMDERFNEHTLVTSGREIRFYAGYPLKLANGQVFGTLSLADDKPREFSEEDRQLFTDLAVMIEEVIAALQLATQDELTGIANRRGFMNLAQYALEFCKRHHRSATVLMIDLDHFKTVNDLYGHAEGDAALVAFTLLLRDEFRASDVIGRIGGDEFIALLTGVGSKKIKATLKRLAQAVENYNFHAARGYELQYSVGYVTSGPDETASLKDLIQDADKLMYESKHKTEDNVVS